jgi:hypothetical protein
VLTFEETTGGSSLRVAACGARPDERGDMCAWRGQADGIPVDNREPLREALVAFLTSIRFGIPAETDSGSGLAVLRALALADKAAVRGQSVEAIV